MAHEIGVFVADAISFQSKNFEENKLQGKRKRGSE